MRLRISSTLALPLLVSFAALAAGQDAAIQPPPVKMGLWQSESTTTMSGMDDSPMARAMAAGGNRTIVTRSCMTADKWKESLARMQNGQRSANCSMSNLQQDSHKISFDEQCEARQGYSSSVHFEMLVDNEENMHGTATVRMSGPAFPPGMTMNMKMNSKYLGSDCGDVKPGEGKVVHE